MQKPLRIALEGNIGVGKSTLLQDLPRYLQGGTWEARVERADEDPEFIRLLNEFYINPNKRVELQSWITKSRTKELVDLDSETHYVFERSFIGDMIFCYANFLNHERPTGDHLGVLYDAMDQGHAFPLDAVVYLNASPAACMKRIDMRSRESEDGIPESYIEYIHNCYETHLPAITQKFGIPVIHVDWNEFHSTEYIAQKIHMTLNIKDDKKDQIQYLKAI